MEVIVRNSSRCKGWRVGRMGERARSLFLRLEGEGGREFDCDQGSSPSAGQDQGPSDVRRSGVDLLVEGAKEVRRGQDWRAQARSACPRRGRSLGVLCHARWSDSEGFGLGIISGRLARVFIRPGVRAGAPDQRAGDGSGGAAARARAACQFSGIKESISVFFMAGIRPKTSVRYSWGSMPRRRQL